MALIEWREEFEVGIPSVDFEHREMIGLLNTLHDELGSDPSDQEVADFLGEIHARIGAHFALEEKVMRDLRYDAYLGHKADHNKLLDDLRDIMDDQDAGAFTQLDAALSDRLHAWFTDHFKTHDARLHRIADH